MSSHVIRMGLEKKELKEKCSNLSKFINENDIFKNLDLDEQVRMIKQLGFMESYLNVLNDRIVAYAESKCVNLK